MGDIFKEQIVKRKPTPLDALKRIGIIAAVFFIFIACNLSEFFRPFSFIVTAAAALGAYFLWGMLKIEYEYAYTNGELDIDVIYSKSRRKRLYSGVVKDFDVMAHVQDKARERDFGSAQVKDYSSGVVGNDSYAFLTTVKGKKTKIIIEPNEMMMKAFSTTLTPRKLFKKQ